MPRIAVYEERTLHPFMCIVVGRLLPLLFIVPGAIALFSGSIELLGLNEQSGFEFADQPEAPYFAVGVGSVVLFCGCLVWRHFGKDLFGIRAKGWRVYER